MQHHDAALERFVARASAQASTLAVVLTGSLARGTERPDSDVDLYLVVTDEHWNEAFARRRLMFTETDGIEYDGGYFDVKLATLDYLDEAAERGDDAVRSSFANVRIAFSRVPDLAERIRRIPHVPEDLWDARVRSFVAQARVHGGYFLEQAASSGDPLLLRHASLHLATSAARAALSVDRILYAGPKYLRAQLRSAPSLPDGFDALVDAVLTDPGTATGTALLAGLDEHYGAALPGDETLSTFVLDSELAWRYRTLPPEYF